jgi:hypothetical protein
MSTMSRELGYQAAATEGFIIWVRRNHQDVPRLQELRIFGHEFVPSSSACPGRQVRSAMAEPSAAKAASGFGCLR